MLILIRGGGVNRFSDRRISQKKLFGYRIWQIFYTDFRILLIQRIADLSNILARIVDLACNLVRILDCDFIVELLADSNLDKTIVGSRILLQIWADRRICIPLFTPPPPPDKQATFLGGILCFFINDENILSIRFELIIFLIDSVGTNMQVFVQLESTFE